MCLAKIAFTQSVEDGPYFLTTREHVGLISLQKPDYPPAATFRISILSPSATGV
jgi:hypothetical protein